MARYRLQPLPVQEVALVEHCGHARFVWNVAVERHAHWRRGRKSAPGFAERGLNRRGGVKAAIIAKLKVREVDRRKDWVEKVSTGLARRFDVIGVEDLKIHNMVRSVKGTAEAPGTNVRAKAGLNRAILAAGWGLLVQRLELRSTPRTRVSDARRAGPWMRKRARAKPFSPAGPAVTPVTPT